MRTAALAKCADRYGLKWTKVESQGGGACPSTGDQVAIQGVLDDTTTNVATALAGGVLADCPGDLLTCEGALSACEAALSGVPGVPLATSQTQCWDTLGTDIPCAGTGQDGELQKGLARAYVDNGDGTITDARTGLMWEKLSDDDSIHDKDSTYTWAEALATKVATLNGGGGFAGYTDWRVPNVNELQSIVNYGAVNPSVSPAFNTGCVPSCTVTSCSCTRSSYYWSSSTFRTSRRTRGSWTSSAATISGSARRTTSTLVRCGVAPEQPFDLCGGQLPSRSQTTFGGGPGKKLSWWKSESPSSPASASWTASRSGEGHQARSEGGV